MIKKIVNKKKRILLISILLISLLLIGILIFLLVSNTPSAKLKKTLKKQEYTCIKDICNKKIDSTIYSINYKEATIKVETLEYSYSYSIDSHNLKLKNEKYNCSYTKEKITKVTPVDETFQYEAKCGVYTKNVNNLLNYFTDIMNESNVNVKDF